MNTTVIQKCLDELSKDAPDLSYLRGMLETFQELNKPVPPILHTRSGMTDRAPVARTETIADEDVGDADATARYLHARPIAPLGQG